MGQHRQREDEEVFSHRGSGPSRKAAGVPYLQHVHALEAVKKVLGSALQTGVQISSNAAETLLLKKSRLVALPVPAQTL